ncbi:MAG: acetylpolyamine amidohydrolase [Acidovorax sp. 17-64-282]|uniref:histone deacetylase family protein n=1 Tax=unclassified Acidovorax TaxID=2684926 RepID=UPI000BC92111|nr:MULTISPECIES: histone deacetylase family protein [unclassified Acidovorax]OZA57890.1 MAG: acetylpolyamine amidohydrolase [Acidovorax sp. 17-64-282]HQS65423.1 histone deacetylase family protein [Acidovorax defluvii]OYY85975.1 MAG: acetylpolyamine amidohydrolase [Acidovorax sp. 28-64-14]OYZ65709.1 MAG: acetylpolyamine amidohydrolase [Acidovorax sp. 24-64-9]HQT19584.1 histone deacetylase family protein [Acidovorax defluvii]
MKTFFHPDQLLHHPQTYMSKGKMRKPQEIPDRAATILQAVKTLGFQVEQPVDGGLAPLRAVHSAPYLQFLESAYLQWKEMPPDWGDEVISNIFVREPNALRGILAQAAAYLADGSCPVGEFTWRSAYWSAQCAVAAAQAVLSGERHAYALCRPPGHHARHDAAGGFCYLNNAAIAAQLLSKQHARVAVFDADMHHGQGIQEIFYTRSDVLYVSIHGDPVNYYPVVTGFAEEIGEGAGSGFNVNLPIPHGSSEQTFFEMVDRALSAIRAYKPDVLVFSLGFDIYKDDPQSQVAVTNDGFRRLGQQIANLDLPTVHVQEGGYHMESLALNVKSFFRGVLG